MPPDQPDTVLSQTQREAILARAIQAHAAPDMRIESQSSGQAMLVYGRRPNHILHFLVGALTCGAWWIVWLILGLSMKERRRLLVVDEYGQVSSKDLG